MERGTRRLGGRGREGARRPEPGSCGCRKGVSHWPDTPTTRAELLTYWYVDHHTQYAELGVDAYEYDHRTRYPMKRSFLFFALVCLVSIQYWIVIECILIHALIPNSPLLRTH